jgi:hypothetical protein
MINKLYKINLYIIIVRVKINNTLNNLVVNRQFNQEINLKMVSLILLIIHLKKLLKNKGIKLFKIKIILN